MSVLGRPTWAIFDVNVHQRVTALVQIYLKEAVQGTTFTPFVIKYLICDCSPLVGERVDPDCI